MRSLAAIALAVVVVLVASCLDSPPADHDETSGHSRIKSAVAAPARTKASEVAPRRRSSLVAPVGVFADEERAFIGRQPMALGDGDEWGPPIRVDADAMEHVGFTLEFEPPTADVDLLLLQWDGEEARTLGVTNWGPGLRVLAAMDPGGRRTFWARARGSIAEGVMTVTTTSIDRGPRCGSDCERLLQLPLPVEEARQGYAIAPSSVYAYQFGRLDLLMALFNAGRKIARAGVSPFQVKGISRWDGGTPPSHRSHSGGVDVDISLYTAEGAPVWYPLCTDAGSRCRRGTQWGFGGEQMALVIAGFFESGLFDTPGDSAVFIDRAYHRSVRSGAERLNEQGVITPEILELFSARRGLLRHVEQHHHHIHVRTGSPPDQEG